MAFEDFLHKRGIPEYDIKRMRDEKVDEEAVSFMTDVELQGYLPHEGDRVSVRAYAERVLTVKSTKQPRIDHTSSVRPKSTQSKPSQKTEKEMTAVSSEEKKTSLVKKLAEKMGFSGQSTCTDEPSRIKDTLLSAIASKSKEKSKSHKGSHKNKNTQSVNATKQDMKIDIGFSVYDYFSSRYKQVRVNNGGGIRCLRLPKPVYKQEIIDEAGLAFFQDGSGVHGLAEDFTYDLAADVAGKQLFKDTETADTFMQRLKMKKLRCYLLAKKHDCDSTSTSEDEDEYNTRERKRRRFPYPPGLSILSSGDDSDLPACKLKVDPVTSVESRAVEGSLVQGRHNANIPLSRINDTASTNNLLLAKEECGAFTTAGEEVIVITDTDQLESTPLFDRQSMYEIPPVSDDIPVDFIHEDWMARESGSFEDEIQFQPGEVNDLDETQPVVIEIPVHRGSVCQDLIAYFSNQTGATSRATRYEIKMVKPDGTIEVAEDNGGVMRDALTEFYETFYLQYTSGKTIVVPVLRHDMTKSKWKAVAEVIRMGYLQENLFPVKLALPFLQEVLVGSADESLCIESFLQYIPEIHRDTLKEAMENGVASVDADELFEVLERWKCRTLPSDATLKDIVSEISHKELVQEPLFVVNSWRPILKTLNLTTREELQQTLAKLRPTTRKVLKSIRFPANMDADENTLSSWLLQFVQEMDSDLLGRFLRFCTGSDLTVKSEITVRFTCTPVRCPTSHTCGSVLEIPQSYAADSFITFRSEFTNVLKSNYWQMDIV